MLKVRNEVFANLRDRVALRMAGLPSPISKAIAASTRSQSPLEGLPARYAPPGTVRTAIPPRRRRLPADLPPTVHLSAAGIRDPSGAPRAFPCVPGISEWFAEGGRARRGPQKQGATLAETRRRADRG